MRRSVPACRRFVRRLAAGLAVLAISLGPVAAQPAAPCPPTAQPLSEAEALSATKAARDHGFLWRISRDGRVSYLYGTLHVARPQWMFPGPRLRQAIEASDTVALELDMLDPDIARRLAAGMRADPDEVLAAPLSARLRAQVEAACLPPAAMAPLAAAVQLAALTTFAGRRDGLDPAYAIDAFLAGYARARGKTVVSLESPEQQLALLKGDPAALPDALDRGLGQLERGQARPLLLRIARVWEQGLTDELARYAQWCECADTAADQDDLRRLLDDRNGPLAERIDALHAAGQRVFAAVGSLHMVGPYGLPALLARRGFSIEPVDLAP